MDSQNQNQVQLTPQQKEMAEAYQMLEQERQAVVQKMLQIQEEMRENEYGIKHESNLYLDLFLRP